MVPLVAWNNDGGGVGGKAPRRAAAARTPTADGTLTTTLRAQGKRGSTKASGGGGGEMYTKLSMWAWWARTATVVVVVGGAGAAPGNQGRQFFSGAGNSLGIGALGNTNTIGYNTQGHANTIKLRQQERQHWIRHGQHPARSASNQWPDSANSGVTTAFYQQASPDYAHDTYVPAWHGTGTAAAHGTDSSPALSALALLGFLYFLNLIQGVLQDNSGRRRRSVPALGLEGGRMEAHKEEEEGHYITSYLEEEPVRGDDGMDGTEEHEEKIDHKAEPRAFSFLEDFFIRLPQALGMQKRQMIDRLGLDKEPMGIASFISSRVKMISSIMSFLQDPSPSRIRRDVQDTDYEELVEGKTFSEPFPSPSLESFVALMTEVLKEYSPFNLWPVGEGRAFSQESDKMAAEEESDERRSVRERRHSPTSMNAWYSELGGRNKEAGGGVGSIAAKAISFLGGGDLAQQAAKQEAGPTLLELSRGLGGSSPHCLQRVLCRLTSHASQLSLFPRVALQMLSSNLVDGSKDAVKAGLRGENCSQTFAESELGSGGAGVPGVVGGWHWRSSGQTMQGVCGLSRAYRVCADENSAAPTWPARHHHRCTHLEQFGS
ncbi:hypothetical protein O3P69_018558 [Scylla paramamosain]|uniref:Uncharacterized protein n=1 Tax=Scylla paramamosain TaxID=85552 RepID=A0AAW0T1P4_SCYPA